MARVRQVLGARQTRRTESVRVVLSFVMSGNPLDDVMKRRASLRRTRGGTRGCILSDIGGERGAFETGDDE